MEVSTAAEFEALVPEAGFSFSAFGNSTQGQLDELNTLHFATNIGGKIRLQDLWVRHPCRQAVAQADREIQATSQSTNKRSRDAVDETSSTTEETTTTGEEKLPHTVIDLDGEKHPTRVKLDIQKREEDLGFTFRMADKEKHPYIMGRDFIFQPDEFLRVIKQQYALPLEERKPSFRACGMWDQFSNLGVVLRTGAFTGFLKGRWGVGEGTGVQLSDFSRDGRAPPSSDRPSLTNNAETVDILRTLETVMITLLSRELEGVFAQLVLAFSGENQTLHVLPSDFLNHTVLTCLESCFSCIRGDRGTPDFVVRSPANCATYIRERIARLIARLSMPAQVAEDMQKYRYAKFRAEALVGITAPAAMATVDKPATRTCRAHEAFLVNSSANPCVYGATCKFQHRTSASASGAEPTKEVAAAVSAKVTGRTVTPHGAVTRAFSRRKGEDRTLKS